MAVKKSRPTVNGKYQKNGKHATGNARNAKGLMEDLKNFVRTRGVDYLKDPNISSVGVGYKFRGGMPTKELSIQFTVKEKASTPEALNRLGSLAIPESFQIGNVTVPTDVLKRDYKVEFR
jgi:endonuclease G